MKTSLLLFFTILITLQLLAQPKTVNIRGIVKDTTVKSIEIPCVIDATLTKFDSKKLSVVNSAFSTSIQIPFPVEIPIQIRDRVKHKNFIYSDADILIDTAGEIHIIGSPIQDEYENEFLPFFQSNDKVYDSLISFYRRYGGDFPINVKDSVTHLREKYGYQRTDLLSKYIKSHPDSYVALWDIYYFTSMPASYKYFDFEKLFSCFSNQLQQGSFMNVLKAKVNESYKMQVGQIFPNDFFSGYEQIQNKITKNNQFYLIDFWYSHCGFCIAEFPKLKKIYTQFHNKGFDIVSISTDKQEDKESYYAAIKKNNLPWHQIWDKDGKVSIKFNINSFPTYMLLDKNNKIINSSINAAELEEFLNNNL